MLPPAMAEPFKNLIHEGTVRSMASHLSRVDARFPAARFQQQALRGLTALELKARAMQLCAALEDTLSPDFNAAADHLEAALGTPGDPLLPHDPIFNGTANEKARNRLVADFDWDTTVPEHALGYRFDIVLRGRDATPMEKTR